MCGLATFFARESVPDWEALDTLFSYTERRGQDGFGIYLNNRDGSGPVIMRFPGKYSDHREEIKAIRPMMKIGSIVIAISRAAPETEAATTDVNKIQPIRNDEHKIVVAHNGAVSNKIHRELQDWAKTSGEYEFGTEIDSESILAAYIQKHKNVKDMMQYLSGGFAAIMYDEEQDVLNVINDHMQIAHGYIKGIGFFLSSELECLDKIIYDNLGVNRDGVNIWEMYYHHYLGGGYIRQVDLQSGFMRKVKYTPRYLVGDTFDSSK